MNNRRKLIVALGAGAVTAPFGSFAQPQNKVWRVGYLDFSSRKSFVDSGRHAALIQGMRDLGYVEGKNLIVEFRWAEGKNDRLPELAAELVRLNVDILVTQSVTTRAAKQATTTIPIVQAVGGDLVALGMAASLARPGGNVTGSTFFPTELAAKRIELLKEAFPRITQVAVLIDPVTQSYETWLQAMQTTARSLKVTLHIFPVRGPDEFDSAFADMVKKRVDAVAVLEQPVFGANAKAIADLAAKQRLPLIGSGEFAETGSVISYGANMLDLYRRVGFFVDKIVKGAKPGDIPVERPNRFDLVINMKTAKALGLKIPNSILVQATKVIE